MSLYFCLINKVVVLLGVEWKSSEKDHLEFLVVLVAIVAKVLIFFLSVYFRKIFLFSLQEEVLKPIIDRWSYGFDAQSDKEIILIPLLAAFEQNLSLERVL